MTVPNFNRFQAILLAVGLVCICAGPETGWTQTGSSLQVKDSPIRVENVRMGGHPEYTRILIETDRNTPYEVSADYGRKKIKVTIRNATLDPRVRTRVLDDVNVRQISAMEIEGHVQVTLRFNHLNTRVVHFVRHHPPQIVVDLQSRPGPMLKGTKSATAAPRKRAPAVPGMTPQQIQEVIRKDTEEKFKGGRKEYDEALKLFQEQKYEEAAEAFKVFREKFPDSPYLSKSAYLEAEALYKIVFKEPIPHYEPALEAYLFAMRRFPDFPFYDHALYKAATIYEDLNYTLEAKTLYLEGIRKNPRSRYNSARELGLAKMLLAEGNYEGAYRAFQRILKTSPKDAEARKGIFEIAKWHYDHHDYARALKVYEEGAQRWPEELKERPEINFYMAEIYFDQKRWSDARRHYFNLINLSPESDQAHLALNRIGDSYLAEGNGQAALPVFNKSRKLDPDSAEAQYATIRLADIGVQYPTLKVRDVIFDVSPYFHPHEAYETVLNDPKNRELLSEATLSRGKAFLKEQRYLEAIAELKKLVPLEPDSRFHLSAVSLIKLALVHLVDQYSRQKGYLPTLYTYSEVVSLGVGNIDNVKTLLQIGEAYKGIGMNAEALDFFEKVKLGDVNGAYTDRLFLNLGEIHLEERNFREAELVARTFLNRYGRSPSVPKAMMILAKAYKGQRKFDKAVKTYNDLLRRNDVERAEVNYNLAETWFAAGNLLNAEQYYRKTIESYDRSIRLPPEYVRNAYYRLGILQHLLNRKQQSLNTLTLARKRFPDHSLRTWADYLIADTLAQLDKKAQAVTELRSLAEDGSENPLIRKAAESKLKVLDWEKRLKELL